MSIASEITRLRNAKAALKESIEAKGVIVEDTAKLDEYSALVDSIPQGGGGGVEEKDVNFYDYDGTCLYSYTKDEFLALNEMPANPDHTDEGLSNDGWGWTLEDAKTYVSKYGKNNIGQGYTTSDNKTKIVVDIPIDNFNFVLQFESSVSTTFDWGDGIINTQPQNNAIHLYLKKGIYIISIGTGDDQLYINTPNLCNGITKDLITKIFFGRTRDTLGTGFTALRNLEAIVLSNTIKYAANISMSYWRLINTIVLNKISYLYNEAISNSSLKIICFSNTENTQTFNSNSFYNTFLKNICIPNSVTTINRSLLYGTALKFFYVPDTITTISEIALPNTLVTLYLYPTIPPTIASNSITKNDYLKIYVPAESVEAYKAATNWSALADKIFPIPTE